jgi:hypothetical protein
MTISATGISGRNSATARLHVTGNDAHFAADGRQRGHGDAGVSDSREDDAAQTLARFQAQLRFIRERGLQTGQFFGISIHPDRWQFMLLQPRDDAAANPGTEESWYGYRWLPLPPDASPPQARSHREN